MRISTIPQIYRNVRRWREIISVLRRYGLADWISRLNIEFFKDIFKDKEGESLARLTREARIRLALTDLGPTFIKLGQILSTRPDVVGVELAHELKKLQTEVPADPPEGVRQLVEAELGQPIDDLFVEFHDEPIASASIGQVHLARTRGGDRVVVKVQHINIEKMVREDLEVLAGLAALAEQLPDFAPYRPSATVAELSRTLRRELDFGREERNLIQFGSAFEKDPTVRIPRPFTDLSTSRVLTMEHLSGIKVSDAAELAAAGFDLPAIARRGAEIYMKMIFTMGFYHADPHPGNILVLPGDTIGMLDFGMVGRLEERMREDIEEMLLAIVHQDTPTLTAIIKRLGSAPPDLDDAALSNDIADFVGMYASQSLEKFNLSGALNDMVEVIHRYHILLPPQLGMLIKVLIMLEGTAKLLSPRFSLMEVIEPYHRRMMLRRLSPVRKLRKMRRVYMEVERLAEVLPQRISDILDQIQAGKFDVHLDHRRLGPSVNRLVLGMLASALFLGSSLLLSQAAPPLIVFPKDSGTILDLFWRWFQLERLSILGFFGCTTAILVGFRLLRAIGKSGHLDRQD